MRKGSGNLGLVARLREQLHEIFVSKVAREGPVSTEAFGEDDFLLNMSSRVNAGEDLTLEQRAKIEAIWKREADGIAK